MWDVIKAIVGLVALTVVLARLERCLHMPGDMEGTLRDDCLKGAEAGSCRYLANLFEKGKSGIKKDVDQAQFYDHHGCVTLHDADCCDAIYYRTAFDEGRQMFGTLACEYGHSFRCVDVADEPKTPPEERRRLLSLACKKYEYEAACEALDAGVPPFAAQKPFEAAASDGGRPTRP